MKPHKQFQNNNMTSQLRHRAKKHLPASSINRMVLQNECVTETPVSSFNPQRLLFNDSDDEQTLRHTAHSSFQIKNNSAISTQRQSRRRPVSRQITGTTGSVRPSMMSGNKDADQSYDDIIQLSSTAIVRSNPKSTQKAEERAPISKTNNFIQEMIGKKLEGGQKRQIRTELRRFHNLKFNLDDDQEESPTPKQAEQKKPEPLQPQVQESECKNSQQKKSKREEIKIPKVQISSLYFQMSDDDDKEKEGQKDEEKQKQNIVVHRQQRQKEREKQRQRERQKQRQTQPQQYIANRGQAFEEKQVDITAVVDITQCKENQQLAKRSLYLQNFIRSNPPPQKLDSLLYTPILPGTKQVFETHIYSSVTEKQYYFWLDTKNDMQQLMKAKKLTHFNRTEFEITTYCKQKKVYIESCRLISNFDRTRFVLLKEERSLNKKRLIGTITLSMSLNNTKSLVFYFPKVNQRNQPTIFYRNSEEIDLQHIYRQNQTQEVDFIMTTRIQTTKKLQIMSAYELRTSQKSMEFKNFQGDLKLIIGKKASKRYKIIAAPGLSPIQIFALLIAQVET